MEDNTNKVTIDAAWFAELYAAKKDKDQYAEAVINIAKERDELKAKLATSQNYEAVIAAKDREIEAVKEERNRLNAKVNELIKGRDERQAEREKVKELKAKLDCADVDREACKDRAEAAERCIEEMWSKMQTFDIPDRQRLIEIEEIICAYREKKEAK